MVPGSTMTVDYTHLSIVLGGALCLVVGLGWLAQRVNGFSAELAGVLRQVRLVLVPLLMLYVYFLWLQPLGVDSPGFKMVFTALIITALWYSLAIVKALFFARHDGPTWQARVPELLVDIGRLAIIAIAASMVIAEVWHKNLGALLATLGVGSIVLGLALQDTLGSLLAGIALVIERPLEVGHWIRVKDLVGQVIEMNWRAVRLQTLNLDTIVIPNSVIAKEYFENYSAPTKIHRMVLPLGFSYQDPPNRVKEIMMAVAKNVKGVLSSPPPELRTVANGDFSVNYEAHLYIQDFGQHQRIRDEFMTQVWYAVRRSGLTIPFPTSTIYRIDTPAPSIAQATADIEGALRRVDLFAEFAGADFEELVAQSRLEHYARGEMIFRQGDGGSALYVILSGRIEILGSDSRGQEISLAFREPGEYFGELTVFAGDPRAAGARVANDVNLVVVERASLGNVLRQRPECASQIAERIEAQKHRYKDVRSALETSGDASVAAGLKPGPGALVDRIRGFFRLGGTS